MKYSGQKKLLCEFSKLSKFNAFNLLGYQTNTDASILVYKHHPERTGFNMYAEYTQLQLTFLALVPWALTSSHGGSLEIKTDSPFKPDLAGSIAAFEESLFQKFGLTFR